MHELGVLEEFLKLPHDEVRELGGQSATTLCSSRIFVFAYGLKIYRARAAMGLPRLSCRSRPALSHFQIDHAG